MHKSRDHLPWALLILLVLPALLLSAAAAEIVIRGLKLKWLPLERAAQYEVQIARHSNMTPVVATHKTEIPQLTLKLPAGTYYYRVRGVHTLGDPGPWGDIEEVAVNPFPPSPLAPAKHERFENPLQRSGIKFQWKAGFTGSRYVIQILDREEPVIEVRLRTTEYAWIPKHAGRFQWRVGYETTLGIDWGRLRDFQVAEAALQVQQPQPIVKVVQVPVIVPSPVPVSAPMPYGASPAQAPAPHFPSKRFHFSPSLTYSQVSYTQTRHQDFSEGALGIKAVASYALVPERFEISANAYGTVLPVATNRAASLRFFGTNLRAGYVIPLPRHPWRLALHAGIYYTTTISTGEGFGFTNLMGPQLFPSLDYRFRDGSELGSYLKFSPVTDGSTLHLLPFQNREMAAGLSYSFGMKGHRLSVGLDFADLKASASELDVQIHSSSLSLGIGYHF